MWGLGSRVYRSAEIVLTLESCGVREPRLFHVPATSPHLPPPGHAGDRIRITQARSGGWHTRSHLGSMLGRKKNASPCKLGRLQCRSVRARRQRQGLFLSRRRGSGTARADARPVVMMPAASFSRLTSIASSTQVAPSRSLVSVAVRHHADVHPMPRVVRQPSQIPHTRGVLGLRVVCRIHRLKHTHASGVRRDPYMCMCMCMCCIAAHACLHVHTCSTCMCCTCTCTCRGHVQHLTAWVSA